MGFIFRTCSWRRILLLLVVLGVSAIRIRLREIPLDRDEGEYAYLVYVTSPLSWLQENHSDRHILTWAKRFVAERYDLIALPDSAGKLLLYQLKTRPPLRYSRR